ncbi:zinc ribbon family protein [Kordia periserrulae]|uniref:Zinc ribbon family protein n=1 Tax=Kordia periserrulae TaxID=701523 RepID=A0A2T6BRJ4_9FLAO|nr:zinc-ribbon domain-containing protein [Kordia periserrulae]PTX58705.1 zinc ribbon family protein [Kordia periserrulae]
MTYFLILGVRDSKLKEKRLNANTSCSNCQRKSSFVVSGEASYFHLFWIPVIPLAKRLYAECTHCGQAYNGKKNFPEDIKRALKEQPVRRPFWHFIVPAFIAYKVLSLVFFYGYMYFENAKEDAAYEKEEERKEAELATYKDAYLTDKKSLAITPNMETDSISYMLKQDFPFSNYNVDASNVALFSKIKQSTNRLLLLIDIQEKKNTKDALACMLINDFKNKIIETYPNKDFDYYIALFENGTLKIVHTPNQSYSTEYKYSVPMYSFYSQDRFANSSVYNFKDRDAKRKMMLENTKTVTESSTIDTAALKKALMDVTKEFSFGYRFKKASFSKRVEYECQFVLEAGRNVPDEMFAMLELYDGNGPFFNWRSLHGRMENMNKEYETAGMEKLTINANVDDKRLLPASRSPHWVLFYADNSYKYALDFSPGKEGFVGQVILIQPQMQPKFIAKNMLAFLKLYRNKKVPMDIEDWVVKKN